MYTGDDGIAQKYNYKEMTIFEKCIFDYYMIAKAGTGVSYDDFKNNLSGFPPVDDSESVIEAYQNIISKYPEDRREKIMGELGYLESPNDKLDMGAIIKNAIDHCKLVYEVYFLFAV